MPTVDQLLGIYSPEFAVRGVVYRHDSGVPGFPYDGDPRDPAAPAALDNAAIGSRYFESTGAEWVMRADGWEKVSARYILLSTRDQMQGTTPKVVTSVYLEAGDILRAESRVRLGAMREDRNAVVRLRSAATGELLVGASWSRAGLLADVLLAGDVTVAATASYYVELLSGDAASTALVQGGRLRVE
jgi:hypothetical protein